MKFLGWEISRAQKALNSVDANRGWFSIIRESFPGAWQTNTEIKFDSVMSHHAVFACQTLIAGDASKLRVKLVEKDSNGIWTETENAAYSPVLRKPNHFQTRIQFWESYFLSKLQRGNTYALKERDNRDVVVALYVLDPMQVKPLVSDSGDVFYELKQDHLAGLTEATVTVPASEIIHDRFNCMFHPLVGVSSIFANGLTATQGLSIQTNAKRFFENSATPGGILTAPGAIGDDTAARLKEHWEANYKGEKAGRVAVLGDGLKFERMTMTSVESQMIEQLKWSAEVVCSTYHVPPYKIGVGALPSFNNVQALNTEYYSQCLQVLLESAEECLDEGLGIGGPWGSKVGTEFDIENLLRMDTVTQMDVLDKAVKAAVYSPNEARAKVDKAPVEGGDSPMIQQQNYSLAALAKRDAKEDPFGKEAPAKPPVDEPEEDDTEEQSRALMAHFEKELANVSYRH
jgi:HK97 family phage portal protein